MYIRKTNSTNSLLLQMLQEQGASLRDGFTVYTFDQTAGRGQAGNSWESEAGKNLLFSRLIRTDLPPQELFRITQYISLVIAEVLSQYTNGIRIKWPNDIYWYDKKICGILIETGFAGNKIDYAVAGVGINVNQALFHSDAPNPISLCQILHQEIDLEELMQAIQEKFDQLKPLLQDHTLLHTQYKQWLYRKDGWHTYVRREVSTAPTQLAIGETDEAFRAKICDVLPNGCLLLMQEDGTLETFHFKQIQYVL